MKEIRNKTSRSSIIFLFILVVVGASLRLINLGQSSFWVEEVKHVYGAQSFLENGEFALPSGLEYNRAQPFTFLVAVSFKLFGINEFAARLPSAIFGTLSILLVFFVGKGLFNERVGLIAALFLTFLPWEIGWSRVCRMYTMFQFLFLWGIYVFYKGFEKEQHLDNSVALQRKNKLMGIISAWSINWKWFIFSGLIFGISFAVHNLTGLFGISLLVYLILMFFAVVYTQGLSQALWSKYFGLFSFIILFTGFVFLIFPQLLQQIKELANFYPYWYKLMDPRSYLYYWELLISDLKFPIGVFFLIGVIQIAIRLNKRGFFLLFCFGVPFVMHSFVFGMKSDKYIFNIFPIFLLIAAYGFGNIIESEIVRIKTLLIKLKVNSKFRNFVNERNLKIAIYVVFFAWLPISRWFFNSFELPTIRSGSKHLGGLYTNGAVTHRDWREACEYVAQMRGENDVVVTSHSLNVYYYLGKVDYVLYRGDLDEIKKYDQKSADGHNLEPFVNAMFIDDLNHFTRIVQEHQRGWLIMDKYRFNQKAYTPPAISDFVKEKMTLHKTSADGTLFVYSWDTDRMQIAGGYR